MKLTGQAGKIAAGLRKAAEAISARPAKPILGSVLIESDGSEVWATGTDLATAVRGRLFDVEASAGKMLIPPNLRKVSERLPDAIVAVISTTDSGVRLVTDLTEATAATENVAEFPALPEPPDDFRFSARAGPLVYALRRAMVAVERVEVSRYALTGVHCETAGDLIFVGCDGRRVLSQSLGRPVDPRGEPVAVTIASDGAEAAARLLADFPAESMVEIGFDSGRVQFQAAGLDVRGGLLEGRFPHWRDAIGESPAAMTTVDARALLGAFRQIEPMIDAHPRFHPSVTLRLAEGSICLVAGRDGDSATSVPCDYGDPAAEVSIQAAFLRQFLGADGLKSFRLGISNDKLSANTEDGLQYVVMGLT